MANTDSITGKNTGTSGHANGTENRNHLLSAAGHARLAGIAAAPDGSEFKTSLYRFVGALADRKWMVAAIVLAAAIGSAAYAFTRTPVYVSTAVLRIEQNPQQAIGLSGLFDSFAYFSIFYQTHLELLKTGKLPAMDKDPATAAGPPEDDRAPMSGHIAVNSNGDPVSTEPASPNQIQQPTFAKMSVGGKEQSRLIRLQMTAADPFAARNQLRKYIEDYIESDRAQRVQLSKNLADGLHKELEEAENRLRKSQQELLDFSIRHDMVRLRNSPTPNVAFFDAARDELVDSRAERWRLQNVQYEMLKVLPGTLSAKMAEDLRGKAAVLKAEYESLGSYFGPRNFQRELLKARVQSLEKAVAEIEADSLSSSLDAARNKERQAREAYEKAKLEAMKSDSLGLQYQVLKKAAEADGDMYIKAMQQLRQAELYDAATDELLAVESSPTLPLEPVSPKKAKIIGIGTLLGLVCGIGLALFLGQLDRTVKSAEEVRLALSIPILGVVPRVNVAANRRMSRGEAGVDAPELSPYRWPTSPLADSLRIVLNAVGGRVNLNSKPVIAVSSALPREGKTFFCAALAAAVASEGKAILIIDCDLRNPRIHKVFGSGPRSVGVSDILSGKDADILEAIRESQIPGLYYLPSGPMPDNPVSLLKSSATRDLVAKCKSTFDMVLIDTPPVLGLADAVVLLGDTDGLILVAKQGHTSLDAVQAATEEISRGQGQLLGLVLNMAERRLGSYGHYHAEYAAKYRGQLPSDDAAANARL